jgi:hypothetical protein
MGEDGRRIKVVVEEVRRMCVQSLMILIQELSLLEEVAEAIGMQLLVVQQVVMVTSPLVKQVGSAVVPEVQEVVNPVVELAQPPVAPHLLEHWAMAAMDAMEQQLVVAIMAVEGVPTVVEEEVGLVIQRVRSSQVKLVLNQEMDRLSSNGMGRIQVCHQH